MSGRENIAKEIMEQIKKNEEKLEVNQKFDEFIQDQINK